jgi:NAD(P)-dependent dehydrogenase (short-subunit alcohol dehydrogenase family)
VGGARRERGRALRGDRLGARARRLTVQVGQAKARGISEERVLEEVILEPHAVKRLLEPEEVAATVSFLVGPGGRGFSGVPVTMDLGWTAR